LGFANAAGTDGAAVVSTGLAELGATADVGDGSVVAMTHDARRPADIARPSRFMD
jgi:hypothetical protein